MNKTAAAEELGLHIDMIDADILHLVANRLELYGDKVPKQTEMVAKLRDIANRMEQEIRDVGRLRANQR